MRIPETPLQVAAIAAELGVELTDAQAAAIATQIAAYESPHTPCTGLHHWALPQGEDVPERTVAVHFTYVREDAEQLPPGPHRLGLEVTLFAADGTVEGSQDFG